MIAVGVDTHRHEQLARALDGLGRLVGGLQIETSLAGYLEFAEWLRELGDEVGVGIEGAGSFGAGLCELLLGDGIQVVEVERPRREDRRRGKSDEIDARAAAKKVLAGDGLSRPRAGGTRQALAALLLAYRSSVAERTRLLNQLQALHTSAPLGLRERIGPGNSQAARGPHYQHARPRGCARGRAADPSRCYEISSVARANSQPRPTPTRPSSPA
jgi:transposase